MDRPANSGFVLVVEDDPVVSVTIKKILERHAFECLVTESGEDGLDAGLEHKERLSLCLIDIRLPGIDGAETMKKLFKIGVSKPTVLMSGYGGDFDRGVVNLPNYCGFLQKPFSAEKLIRTIRESLEKPLSD